MSDPMRIFVYSSYFDEHDGTESKRPSHVFKPELAKLHDEWIARYYSFSASGSTPEEAMRAFDRAWVGEK